MSDASESPKGYRYPKSVIGHAVYLYHRLAMSYRDVQELLFKRGIDVSHETVRAWCVRFGPDLAEALRQRKPKRGCVWHPDEMRIVMGGVTLLTVASRQRAWRGARRAAAKDAL